MVKYRYALLVTFICINKDTNLTAMDTDNEEEIAQVSIQSGNEKLTIIVQNSDKMFIDSSSRNLESYFNSSTKEFFIKTFAQCTITLPTSVRLIAKTTGNIKLVTPYSTVNTQAPAVYFASALLYGATVYNWEDRHKDIGFIVGKSKTHPRKLIQLKSARGTITVQKYHGEVTMIR